MQKALCIAKWVLVGFFAFLAVTMFCTKNLVSGIFNALFAVFISPVMQEIFDKLNVKLSRGVKILVGICLFAASFATFVVFSDLKTEAGPKNEVVENSVQMKEVPNEGNVEPITVDLPAGELVVEESVASANKTKMKVHFLDVG